MLKGIMILIILSLTFDSANAGQTTWKLPVEGDVNSVSLAIDFIAAGTSGGYVYLLDRRGETKWRGKIGNPVRNVALEKRGGYIIAGDLDTAYIFKEGNLVWKKSFGKGIKSLAISEDGNYFLIAAGDEIHLFSPSLLFYGGIEIASPSENEVVTGVVEIKASVNHSYENLLVLINGNYACGSLPCYWDTGRVTEGIYEITVRTISSDDRVVEKRVNVRVDRAAASLAVFEGKKDTLPGSQIGKDGLTEGIKATLGGLEEYLDEIHALQAMLDRRTNFDPPKVLVLSAVLVLILIKVLYAKKAGKKYRWKGRIKASPF